MFRMSYSTITLSNDAHGSFTVNAQRVEDLMDAATGSVNFQVSVVQAYCSEATGFYYFDMGILELCCVMAGGLGIDPATLTEVLGSDYYSPAKIEAIRESVQPYRYGA